MSGQAIFSPDSIFKAQAKGLTPKLVEGMVDFFPLKFVYL